METTVDGKALFAVFSGHNETMRAIQALRKLGFAPENMRIFEPKKTGGEDLSGKQRYQWRMGAIVGAIFGFFVGGVISAILVPNLAEYVPWLQSNFFPYVIVIFFSTLIGTACGLLVGIGTPDSASKRYAEYLEAGGILLEINPENADLIPKIENILEENGGSDIHMAVEKDTLDNLKGLDFDIIEAKGNAVGK